MNPKIIASHTGNALVRISSADAEQGASITHRGKRRILAIAVALAAALSSQLLRTAAAAESSDPVTAVWKSQRMNFVYRGFSTMYSCQGLREKLEKILLSVGAREGIAMRANGCSDELVSGTFQIVLQAPVIATEETMRELTTYDSTDELAARVRGDSLPKAEDIERFPAVWKTVSFARDGGMRLDPGDCELVQQLRRQILPRMSVQIVRNDVHCSSAFGNITPPRLTVSALVPLEADSKKHAGI